MRIERGGDGDRDGEGGEDRNVEDGDGPWEEEGREMKV